MTEQKRKPYFISNDEADYEALKNAIDEILEEALDPEAYAVRQMFNKIKEPEPKFDDDAYDVEAWEKRDTWIPRGTKFK